MWKKSKLTCSNCGREVNDGEKIALIVRVEELNGRVSINGFAKLHDIICNTCYTINNNIE